MPPVRYVIVSGLPGAGKTTVGSRIAPLLEMPLVDKDAILESMFDERRANDPGQRQILSRQADLVMRRRIETLDSAVLVSHWRRPELSTTSGTPTHWLEGLPGVVEVYCRCAPATAAKRFLARPRHRSHGDDAVGGEMLLEQFHARAALGPLGIGRTVVAETEGDVDVTAVVRGITG